MTIPDTNTNANTRTHDYSAELTSAEVANRSTTLFVETIAIDNMFHGTKIIARDMPGAGKIPSSQRFRAVVRADRAAYNRGRATVEVWSACGWVFVEEVILALLPISDGPQLPGEWEDAMEESLDRLLVIGLDVVPC